jgi:methylase of polypeptide subunit release factors
MKHWTRLYEGKLKLFKAAVTIAFSRRAAAGPFMTCRHGEKIADLGTGNGVIALILAYLHSSLSITGVEIQLSMVDRACRNVRMNGFRERVTIIQADVRNIPETLSAESFAAVVCNPPYRQAISGRISPNDERKIARHEIAGGLGDSRAGLTCCPSKEESRWSIPPSVSSTCFNPCATRISAEASTDGSFLCRYERCSSW